MSDKDLKNIEDAKRLMNLVLTFSSKGSKLYSDFIALLDALKKAPGSEDTQNKLKDMRFKLNDVFQYIFLSTTFYDSLFGKDEQEVIDGKQ